MRVSFSLFFSLRRIWWLCFCGLYWDPLQLWTPAFDANVRAVKHSATCHLFFMHLFPCLSGLTGCGCFGIIIIISDRQFEPTLEPRLCTPDSSHFQLSSLFKREGQNRREGETRGSQGAYLSLKSHLCAHSILFLKGASIAMPNLVQVLIKGLLYCYSLHNCVRCLWKLMAQQSPDVLLRLYTLSNELMFLNSFQLKSVFSLTFCSLASVDKTLKENCFTVAQFLWNAVFKKGLKLSKLPPKYIYTANKHTEGRQIRRKIAAHCKC